MFSFALVATIFTGALFVAIAGNLYLLLLNLGILAIYCSLLILDIYRVDWTSKTKVATKKVPNFYTSIGTELYSSIAALCYSQELRVSEARQTSLRKDFLSRPQSEEISLIRSAREELDGGEMIVYERVVEFLWNKLKSDAVALLVGDEGGTTKIYSQECDSRRIQSNLRHLFEWYGKSKHLDSVYGLVNEEAESDLVASFYEEGFYYTIRLPFTPRTSDGYLNALIFLGYRSPNEPSLEELNLAKSLRDKLEQEYEASKAIASLEKKTNELEGSNKAKSDFISHVSHDIRSPLNNIRSIINLFKQEGISEETEDMLDVALSNCENLSEIVEVILDFSRFSAGKLVSRPEIFDVRDLLQNVLESFAVTARLKGLDLKIRQSSHSVALINADKKQMKRVLSNLISNAIKYTDHGFVEVSVKIVDGISWRIKIRDTGIGMTESQVAQLFSPFTRFNTGKEEGVGLGLALTKILVETNQGKINATSNIGAGSVFTIDLPRAIKAELNERDLLPTAAELVSDNVVNEYGSKVVSKLRILVVDDDRDCVETIGRSLEMRGYNIFKAISVTNAINIYNYELPDVVITDLSMPEGGGRRLIDYVLKSSHNSKLIILSGSVDRIGSDYAESDGIISLLDKPVDLDLLFDLLGKCKPDQANLKAA